MKKKNKTKKGPGQSFLEVSSFLIPPVSSLPSARPYPEPQGRRGRTSLFTGHSPEEPVGRACAPWALCAGCSKPLVCVLPPGEGAGPRAGPSRRVRTGQRQGGGRARGGASGNNTRSGGPGYLLLRRLSRVMVLAPNLPAAVAAAAAP